MSEIGKNPATSGAPDLDSILKIAVMAVGGQGGGVLTTWIETLARAGGYACQATSVAGVAQRTGATIYYIEMAAPDVAAPVFALAPSAGDVDVVIAAEMMEAGRAILRGFVTPDQTTLIASTHRALAVSEKTVPGDGIAASEEVQATAELAARQLIMLDLEQVANAAGSVISASLFGALAASGRLPFQREAFETAIRAGGKGVNASLRAFEAAHDLALEPVSPGTARIENSAKIGADGPAKLMKRWQALEQRVQELPKTVRQMTTAGLQKVVDFQDVAYGELYLARIEDVYARDQPEMNHLLTLEAAKHVANAMTYDDLIKVADLKTRAQRIGRVAEEMNLMPDQHMKLTEYFHPRAEEIVGLMPAGFGARIANNPMWMARLNRWFGKGRRIRTDRMTGFLVQYVLGGLQGWRLKTLRHAQEVAHLEAWLSNSLSHVTSDYELAVELLRCRRLIKGYSDTHARGHSKFDQVCGAAKILSGRKDAADWIRRLRDAALQDEKGTALDGALRTIATFG